MKFCEYMSCKFFPRLILGCLLSTVVPLTCLCAESSSGAADRAYSVQVLIRVAGPVLTALAEDKLRERLPQYDWERDRTNFTHLEAFGRTLAGIAP